MENGHNSKTVTKGSRLRFGRSRSRSIPRSQWGRTLATTKTKLNRIAKVVRQAEIKEFIALSATIAVNSTAIPTVPAYDLTIGTSGSNRIGNDIMAKWLKLRFYISCGDNVSVRLLIIQNNTGSPVVDNTATLTTIQDIPLLNSTFNNYKIIADKTFNKDTDVNTVAAEQRFVYSQTIKINKKWNYSATTATNPLYAPGTIQFILLGNQANADNSFVQAVLGFTDD